MRATVYNINKIFASEQNIFAKIPTYYIIYKLNC